MRVIAGTARSLPLKTPAGMDTRPTTDRIKETLFNILQPYVPDSVFIDIFSGSGGIGIEALSRGARKAYLIDHAAPAVACIKQNLQFTGLADRAVVLKQDAAGALRGIAEKEADIVFLDPPYNRELEKQALQVLAECGFVTGRTWIVVEADIGTDFSYVGELGYSLDREKKYKTNKHVFLRRAEEKA